MIRSPLRGILPPVRARSQFDEKSDSKVLVDGLKFRQLMMNLIKNAVEAIPNGGNVYIFTTRLKSNILIGVRDDGVGMTKAQLQRLGKPFYSTKAKGTGLGLMVTFRLVEAMGGQLEFESVKGKGTTAMIRLPLYTANDAKSDDLQLEFSK